MQATGLGSWLVERCRVEGLSLRQAGAKTGLSHATIRDIMNGSSASAETIRKLALGFGGGGHHSRLAVEDKLLTLSGYRSERPEEKLSEPVVGLLDKLSQFSERELKIMERFAEFLAEMEKK